MQLPGLITLTPDQEQLKNAVAQLLAEASLSEPWMATFLEGIKCNDDQKREFTQLKFHNLVELGAGAGRVFSLIDGSGAFIAYRHSEQEFDNEYYEGEATKYAEANCSLDSNHRYLITSQQAIMAPVSDFGWEEEFTGGADFIHLVAVASTKGSSAFADLLKPLFDYADANRLAVFTECFGDDVQATLEGMGFDALQVLEAEMPVKLSIDFGENAPKMTQDDIFRELEILGSGGARAEAAMGGMKLKKETVPFSERMMGRRPQFHLA